MTHIDKRWVLGFVVGVGAALIAAVIVVPSVTSASTVSLPFEFTNGQVADANQVNENFSALANGVNDNDRRLRAIEGSLQSGDGRLSALEEDVNSISEDNIELRQTVATLESLVSDLEARIASLESSQPTPEQLRVLETMTVVDIDDGFGNALTTLLIEGANLQITNGQGQTASSNGLGNVIVGYQEERTGGPNDRSGSHNLVVGRGHNYSRFGGIVAGRENAIVGIYSTVTGGTENIAAGEDSSVSGGCQRAAVGLCDWQAGDLFQDQ